MLFILDVRLKCLFVQFSSILNVELEKKNGDKNYVFTCAEYFPLEEVTAEKEKCETKKRRCKTIIAFLDRYIIRSVTSLRNQTVLDTPGVQARVRRPQRGS